MFADSPSADVTDNTDQNRFELRLNGQKVRGHAHESVRRDRSAIESWSPGGPTTITPVC